MTLTSFLIHSLFSLQPGKGIPQGATILKLVTTQAGATAGKPATLISAGQLGTSVAVGAAQQVQVCALSHYSSCHVFIISLAFR
jgi:hypothetical protein